MITTWPSKTVVSSQFTPTFSWIIPSWSPLLRRHFSLFSQKFSWHFCIGFHFQTKSLTLFYRDWFFEFFLRVYSAEHVTRQCIYRTLNVITDTICFVSDLRFNVFSHKVIVAVSVGRRREAKAIGSVRVVSVPIWSDVLTKYAGSLIIQKNDREQCAVWIMGYFFDVLNIIHL